MYAYDHVENVITSPNCQIKQHTDVNTLEPRTYSLHVIALYVGTLFADMKHIISAEVVQAICDTPSLRKSKLCSS